MVLDEMLSCKSMSRVDGNFLNFTVDFDFSVSEEGRRTEEKPVFKRLERRSRVNVKSEYEE